jgi:alpha-galactosidase
MAKFPKNTPAVEQTSEIIAAPVLREFEVDAEHAAAEWENATPVTFCTDWQGKNPDLARETRVRVLWSWRTLFLRFECRYRELFFFAESEANGRRDHLWERDVVESFLQPSPAQKSRYKEFELSPNGMWIDLDIFPGGRSDLKSGLGHSVFLDREAGVWAGEMAIPMRVLTQSFDPQMLWRANFYRVEGSAEPRAYLAWRPTGTQEPNFHVPAAFGKLRFAP